jgi:hypothetical protein
VELDVSGSFDGGSWILDDQKLRRWTEKRSRLQSAATTHAERERGAEDKGLLIIRRRAIFLRIVSIGVITLLALSSVLPLLPLYPPSAPP